MVFTGKAVKICITPRSIVTERNDEGTRVGEKVAHLRYNLYSNYKPRVGSCPICSHMCNS